MAARRVDILVTFCLVPRFGLALAKDRDNSHKSTKTSVFSCLSDAWLNWGCEVHHLSFGAITGSAGACEIVRSSNRLPPCADVARYPCSIPIDVEFLSEACESCSFRSRAMRIQCGGFPHQFSPLHCLLLLTMTWAFSELRLSQLLKRGLCLCSLSRSCRKEHVPWLCHILGLSLDVALVWNCGHWTILRA